MSTRTDKKAQKQSNGTPGVSSVPGFGGKEEEQTPSLSLAPGVEATGLRSSVGSAEARQRASRISNKSHRNSREKREAAYYDLEDSEDDFEDAMATPGATSLQGSNRTGNGNHTAAESEMVNAQIVDEEELEAQIIERKTEEIRRQVIGEAVVATKVEKPEEDLSFWRRHGIKIGILVSLAVIIGGVVIAIVSSQDDGGNPVTLPPTLAPTSFNDYDNIVNLLAPISGKEALEDPTLPQFEAIQWLVSTLQDETPLSVRELRERYVVALFYFSTGGDGWFDDLGFLSTSSVCEWSNNTELGEQGVACSQNGFVTSIQLEQNNLNGTIPHELSVLRDLRVLNFEDNQLYGSIPETMGDIRELDNLNLRTNALTGSIPESLTQLSLMEELRLSFNQMTGTIPSGLTKMPNVEILLLAFNFLIGTIPDYLAFSRLKFISFEENLLSGTIPVSYTFQNSMESFNVGSNINIYGTIPTEIGLLSKLEYLHLADDSLTGTIPTSMGRLDEITDIYLSGNNLSGTIPAELGELQRLERLWLNDNNLTGTIPSELADFKNAIALRFRNNSLTGTVPAEFGAMEAFWGDGLFDVGFNDLNGTLDAVFCDTEGVPPLFLSADCGEVICSCCTDCCDDSTGECEANVPLICESTKDFYESGFGEELGTQCECLDDGLLLACSDTCETCNDEGTICFQSVDYGYTYDETGLDNNYRCTVEYVVGRNETISIIADQKVGTCELFIDDVQCNSCGFLSCDSGFRGFILDCSNIGDELVFNACDPDLSLGVGPLDAFRFEYLLKDCFSCI